MDRQISRKVLLRFNLLLLGLSFPFLVTSSSLAQGSIKQEMNRLVNGSDKQERVIATHYQVGFLEVSQASGSPHPQSSQPLNSVIDWIQQHRWLAIVVVITTIQTLYLLIVIFHPLWFLLLPSRFEFSIAGIDLSPDIFWTLKYHPRVLDAWVAAHINSVRENFQSRVTVANRQIYLPLPVFLNNNALSQLSAKDLHPVFARNRCLVLIWGEGGSGKTSLACQIARWGMADDVNERLCPHRMLPVLIEQELYSEARTDKRSLIQAIQGQLQNLADLPEPISDELLEQLLRKRRILVIIDHFSEMSEATRRLVQPERADFPINALVVTSRIQESLGHAFKTTIRPLRIESHRIAYFVTEYLTQQGLQNLLTDEELFAVCGRLSRMLGQRNITPLLAALYTQQIIASQLGSEHSLPENIPDLFLTYINILNESIEPIIRLENRYVHRDSMVVAWECLKKTYRPSSAIINQLLEALARIDEENDANARLDYLEHYLRLIQILEPGNKAAFTFDILAEYLAGLHLVNSYGNNEEAWRQFLTQADTQQGSPESIQAFLLAVLDCCLTKGKEANVPDFVAEELSQRVGTVLEAIVPSQLEPTRRIIPSLSIGNQDTLVQPESVSALIQSLTDPDANIRSSAAIALGRIETDATEVVPVLIRTLADQDANVRLSVAISLGRLGPEASAAAPALTQTLADPSNEVREASIAALKRIGAEAVPTLIQALTSDDNNIRLSAALILGDIGKEAKTAIPALIATLQDEDAAVRGNAAASLGSISSEVEAKAAIPVLTKALEDSDIVVRRNAAVALGRIGIEGTPFAVSALLKSLLEDPDSVVRGNAATSLGTGGSESKRAIPALIEALKDADQTVRKRAASALRKIGPLDEQEQQREKSYPIWSESIRNSLLQENYADLKAFPEIHRDFIWNQFCKDYEFLNLSFHPDTLVLEISEREKINAFKEFWNQAKSALTENEVEAFRAATHQLTELFCEVLAFRELENFASLGQLYGWKIDASNPAFELNIRREEFPVIYLCKTRFSEEDVRDVTGLLNQFRIYANFFALLVPFENYQQLRQQVRESAYKNDFIVLDHDQFWDILAAKSPIQQLIHCILEQIDLVAVSPYTVGGPVKENMFFGRAAEEKTLLQNISRNDYALLANRKVGKTSLLNRVFPRLKKVQNYQVFYCDLQAVGDYKSFYAELAISYPEFEEIGDLDEPSPVDFRKVVTNIKNNSNRQIIFMFDEVDELLTYDLQFQENLFKTFRSLSQRENVHFVFSGTTTLVKRVRHPDSPLFNFCDLIKLQLLEEKAARALIIQPMRAISVRFENEETITQRILSITAHHPNMIQYICTELIRITNKKQQRVISEADLDMVIHSQEFYEYFEGLIWGQSTDLERLIIYTMWPFSEFTEAEVIEEFRQRDIATEGLAGALETLQIYLTLSKQNGKYFFTFREFAKLMAKHSDIQTLAATYQQKFRRGGSNGYL